MQKLENGVDLLKPDNFLKKKKKTNARNVIIKKKVALS